MNDLERYKRTTAVKVSWQLMEVNGVSVEVTTVAGLAKMVGRKASTIRALERDGKFPPANIRSEPVSRIKGTLEEGDRLYTRKLVYKLVDAFSRIQQGKPTPASVTADIYKAFKEERKMLLGS